MEDAVAALRYEIIDEDPAPGSCFGHEGDVATEGGFVIPLGQVGSGVQRNEQ
jgi:hypothetical protein